MLLFLLFSLSNADEVLYAVKGGLLAHSTGPVSSGIEDGIDAHAEVLFKDRLLKAYPSIGADINLNGDTSFLYAGLSWEGKFFDLLHLGTFLGPSIHDGESDNGDSDKRQLGSRILVRAAIDIGVYLTDDIALSFMYDHYSNTGLIEKRNQGNDNMGLRMSLYF
jgi:lipid A 3-O-deacylase